MLISIVFGFITWKKKLNFVENKTKSALDGMKYSDTYNQKVWFSRLHAFASIIVFIRSNDEKNAHCVNRLIGKLVFFLTNKIFSAHILAVFYSHSFFFAQPDFMKSWLYDFFSTSTRQKKSRQNWHIQLIFIREYAWQEIKMEREKTIQTKSKNGVISSCGAYCSLSNHFLCVLFTLSIQCMLI